MSKLMYLHSQNKLPSPLMNMFTVNRDIHEHDTRTRNHPRIPSWNTEVIGGTFVRKAPVLWYSIPERVKTEKSIKSFVKKYKTELLDKM